MRIASWRVLVTGVPPVTTVGIQYLLNEQLKLLDPIQGREEKL